MKKSIFIWIALILGAMACNDSDIENCSTCSPEKPIATKCVLKFSEQKFDIYLDDGRMQEPVAYNLALSSKPVSNEVIEAVKSYLSKIISDFPLEIVNIVLISDTLEDTDIANLIGVLTYSMDNGNLRTNCWKNELGKFAKIEQLNLAVSKLYSNDFFEFAKYVNSDNSKNVGIISLMGNDFKTSKQKNLLDFHEVCRRLNSNISHKKAPPLGCNLPCAYYPDENGCAGGYAGYYCDTDKKDPGECPEEETQATIVSNGYSYSYNNNVLYQMRDYLGSTRQGHSYIDDYCYIGHLIATEGINITLALDAMNLGVSVINPILTSFLANPQSQTSLYNSSEAQDIIDFLNDFKTVSTDIRFNQIINDLISLVNSNIGASSLQISQVILQ